MKNRIGEENINTQGTLMRIIGYNRNDDIIVEFQDEYKVKKSAEYKSFKYGNIKNPYDKSVYGVGYLGYANSKDNRKLYCIWKDMIRRCYNTNFKQYNIYEIINDIEVIINRSSGFGINFFDLLKAK